MSTARDTFFCDAYLSQPLHRIRASSVKAGGGVDDRGFLGMTYSFVEAVDTFGERLDDTDLYWAYKRIGRSFRGQLEGLFLVLSKAGRSRHPSLPPPSRPSGQSNPSQASKNLATGVNKTGLKCKG
jgi:hypothetical protein